MSEPRHGPALSVGLAFVAGYVDTLGFIALFGLFTAHVTGNFVLIGAAFVHSSGGLLLKLLVFPAFIVAVAATRLIVLWLERRGHDALVPLLCLQAALLVAFMLAGGRAWPVLNADAPLALCAGIAAALAMGLQNAASRLLLSGLAPTTVMTGNVTQLVLDAVDLMRGAADDVVRQRSRKLIAPIVAFALGALGAALGYVWFQFWALLAPILTLGGLALVCAGSATGEGAGRVTVTSGH